MEFSNDHVIAFLDDYYSRPQLPRDIGNYNDNVLSVNKGRFGPYIKFGDLFVSLAKADDPYTISLERAIELCEAKAKSEASKVIKSFEQDSNIQVLNGRYGAYIKFGKDNVKIPANVEPEQMTYEQLIEIIKNQAPAPTKGKAAPKAKTAAPKAKTAAKPKAKKTTAKKK